MAVTITMAVDVTMDVITAGDFPAEIIPAAIFFGSSFFYACAEITAGAATTDVVTETAAGLLSYCFCCVAMDVAAAADLHFYCGSFLARSFLRFFSILFLPALLFFFELFKDFTFALHSVLFDAFFIYLVYVVTIYDKHISFFYNICCKHA